MVKREQKAFGWNEGRMASWGEAEFGFSSKLDQRRAKGAHTAGGLQRVGLSGKLGRP